MARLKQAAESNSELLAAFAKSNLENSMLIAALAAMMAANTLLVIAAADMLTDGAQKTEA
jgi:hypothetical protein